jgi:hypothetical protein
MRTTKSQLRISLQSWIELKEDSLLSYSGRLEMTNSMIMPIATYAMCTIKLHKGAIKNIDRARKQCI